MTAIAKTVELIELREHLGAGFSARHASVELDDVAELACEWTAARELHPNVKVVIELQEIEARYRRLGNVGLKFLCFEQPFARARLPGFHEFVDNALGFAEDTEVRRLIKVGARCDAGSADDHRFSPGMAEVDNVEHVALLRQHASGQDQIGPVDVIIDQFVGVPVEKAKRPGAGQQSRNGDQAQRRCWMFGTEHFSGPLEVPKRVCVEPRIDQKCVAGFASRHPIHLPPDPRPPPAIYVSNGRVSRYGSQVYGPCCDSRRHFP